MRSDEELPPRVRRAGVGDAELLAELGARTFVETFAKDNSPEDMALYLVSAFGPAVQAAELGDAATMAFVAEREGAAAGYAVLRAGRAPECVTGARPIELTRLYVLARWIGRGVGDALMRECVEAAAGARHETLWLGVWERNVRAQAFYRRWGFRHVGEHVFRLGTDPQIDWLMERSLDPP